MRPRSVLSACEYRPAIAATNSSRAAMLIRLIPDPADEHRSGANQMRQWLSFQEHSRRGNASSHPDRRATIIPIFLREIDSFLALAPAERAKPTPLFFIFHLLGESRAD